MFHLTVPLQWAPWVWHSADVSQLVGSWLSDGR